MLDEREKEIEIISSALKILCDALQLDPDYYETWKSNIAMSFQDAYNNYIKDKPLFFEELPDNWLHDVSNTAADNFLQLLISQTEKK